MPRVFSLFLDSWRAVKYVYCIIWYEVHTSRILHTTSLLEEDYYLKKNRLR